MKPAIEPIILARKPLSEGTVAANVLAHGTGALNVDGCRVACDPADLGDPTRFQASRKGADSWDRQDKGMFDAGRAGGWANGAPSGRWPANLIHDGSEEVVAMFPAKAGAAAPVASGFAGHSRGIYGDFAQKGDDGATFHNDSGSAARFFASCPYDDEDFKPLFYCAKASKRERNEGAISYTLKEGVPLEILRKIQEVLTNCPDAL